MGAATSGGLSAGGIIDAVILDIFVDNNLANGFRTVKVASNMADRKTGLATNADMFVVLPGGLGTLDELTDVMCQRQLLIHEKPVVVVNVDGYFNHLKSFLRECTIRNFVTEAISRAVLFADSPEEAIGLLKTHKTVEIDKECLHSGEIAAASKRVR